MALEPKSRQSLRFQVGEESPYAQVEVSKVEKESDRIINSLRQVINQQTVVLRRSDGSGRRALAPERDADGPFLPPRIRRDSHRKTARARLCGSRRTELLR